MTSGRSHPAGAKVAQRNKTTTQMISNTSWNDGMSHIWQGLTAEAKISLNAFPAYG